MPRAWQLFTTVSVISTTGGWRRSAAPSTSSLADEKRKVEAERREQVKLAPESLVCQ